MIAKPKYSGKLLPFFDRVFYPLMRARVSQIWIRGIPKAVDDNIPIVCIANHASNWDGFLSREVHRYIHPKRPIYSIMLEKQLDKYFVLKWLGGVGFIPQSISSTIHLIRRLKTLRQSDSQFSLAVFPQGKIWPSAKRPLGFKRGIESFVRAVLPCTILPIGIHFEAMNALKPTGFISVGKPLKVTGPIQSRDWEKQVETLLQKTTQDLCRYGENSEKIWSEEGAKHLW